MTQTSSHQELQLTLPDGTKVFGDLAAPTKETSDFLVVFAHGSGSSRKSPRNMFVAGELRKSGATTFLCDLLTREEEMQDAYTGSLRFNILFLAKRLNEVVDALRGKAKPETAKLRLGLFGASTGAAAAITCAAKRNDVEAIVSRGGRPDLSPDSCLASVKAPILALVGGEDRDVIKMNESALAKMKNAAQRDLVIVPGATHLFEESGTLEQVAVKSAEFFKRHLHREQQQFKQHEKQEQQQSQHQQHQEKQLHAAKEKEAAVQQAP